MTADEIAARVSAYSLPAQLADNIASVIRDEREACAKLCADRARQLLAALDFADSPLSKAALTIQIRVLEDAAEGIRARV